MTSKRTRRSKEEITEILEDIQDLRAKCVQPRHVRRQIRDKYELSKEMGLYYYKQYEELLDIEAKGFDAKRALKELHKQCGYAIEKAIETDDLSVALQWQKFIKETFLDTAPNSEIPKHIHYHVMSDEKIAEEKAKNQKTFDRDTKPNDEEPNEG